MSRWSKFIESRSLTAQTLSLFIVLAVLPFFITPYVKYWGVVSELISTFFKWMLAWFV